MLPSFRNTSDSGESTIRRATDLFAEYQHDIHARTDRLFAGLMAFQWVSGIVFALCVSGGAISRNTSHVWLAILAGGVICSLPALLAMRRPGAASTQIGRASCRERV